MLDPLQHHGHGLQQVEDPLLVARGEDSLAIVTGAVRDPGAGQHLVHRPPALDQLLLSQGVFLLAADISLEHLGSLSLNHSDSSKKFIVKVMLDFLLHLHTYFSFPSFDTDL